MNRCFTNNNIIPIKSSKEHIEDKRNKKTGNRCPLLFLPFEQRTLSTISSTNNTTSNSNGS